MGGHTVIPSHLSAEVRRMQSELLAQREELAIAQVRETQRLQLEKIKAEQQAQLALLESQRAHNARQRQLEIEQTELAMLEQQAAREAWEASQAAWVGPSSDDERATSPVGDGPRSVGGTSRHYGGDESEEESVAQTRHTQQPQVQHQPTTGPGSSSSQADRWS